MENARIELNDLHQPNAESQRVAMNVPATAGEGYANYLGGGL